MDGKMEECLPVVAIVRADKIKGLIYLLSIVDCKSIFHYSSVPLEYSIK
jgi:hypothetical protein